ncbi:KIR-like protein [Plasmodium coatneyi]|uniref:KIR-like protein n=1 Tax=Plasmodium coatneyi TaxID=208452 RepID=A0A1B1E7N6_9APIC|nr:KIR-like protein [Plasmodium coatneyi]ANQ11015.1 KIR-like protein [Plasmodium coatneyi]
MSSGPFISGLPSEFDFYDKFERSEEECTSTNGNCDTERKNYSLKGNEYNNCREQFEKALGHIYKEYRNNVQKKSLECTARHFLYYWFGDKLTKTKEGREKFQGALSVICRAIRDSCTSGQQCKLPCDSDSNRVHVDKDIFNNRKTLFDFWYDGNIVQTLLQISGSEGFQICKSYVESVEATKGKMEQSCTNERSGDDYCTNFWHQHKIDIGQKLSALKSQLTTAKKRIEREAQAASSKTEEMIRGATTTSSISSIIGTLAATALPFFLYKYKPWSSWFGNHASGGRRSNIRGRRSAGSDIDDLTETSTTVDFTESSETSSILDSTTIRSPAAYNTRKPNRGERTARAGINSNRPGHHQNIGYQNI